MGGLVHGLKLTTDTLSFLESTKTKNEAVPNLINKHLILIMTVIVMIAMTEVYVDQEAD